MKSSSFKVIWACFLAYMVGGFSMGFTLLGDLLSRFGVPILGNLLGGVLYGAVSFLLCRLITTNYLEDNAEYYGFGKVKFDKKWILIASILPSIVLVIMLLLGGKIYFNGGSIESILTSLSIGIFLQSIGGPIAEEVVYRGVMFHVLEKRFGRYLGVLIPSFIFALAHTSKLFSISENMLVIIAGTLMGILLTLVTIYKKSIWYSIIVHSFWNFILLALVGSGNASLDPLFKLEFPFKSLLLFGGEWGVENSLPAICVYVLASYFIWHLIRKGKKES